MSTAGPTAFAYFDGSVGCYVRVERSVVGRSITCDVEHEEHEKEEILFQWAQTRLREVSESSERVLRKQVRKLRPDLLARRH